MTSAGPTRRHFLVITVWSAVFSPAPAVGAQQGKKPWQIGVLMNTSPPAPSAPPSRLRSAFLGGLRERGYVDGRDIAIASRWGEGDADRLSKGAAELVALPVDVIFATSLQAGLAAKRATNTIPIVFVSFGDPVADGLVSSLAKPSGNVTGVASGGEIAGLRLQLLKEIAPASRRVAVLWNSANPGNARVLKVLADAARRLDLQLDPQAVPEPAELVPVLTRLMKNRVDGMLVIADPMLSQHHAVIVDVAAKSRLPAIYAERSTVAAGGLMSYQADLADLHRRAATYVVRILEGSRPADLPVEMSTAAELVINLKTARALGLTIPPSILLRAGQVIE